MKLAPPLPRANALPRASDAPLSSTARQALVGGVPALALLSPAAQAEIAGSLHEERFATGAVIVREGELGDRCFLLAEGEAEVSTQHGGKALPLALLGPGEMFGELALLSDDKTRQATVTATSDVRALTLAAADFDRIRREDAAVETALQKVRNTLEVARFLKQVTPFASLDAEALRNLQARLELLTVDAGEEIIRQGEAGDTCYLLRSGKTEVLVQEEQQSTPRRVATLYPGTLFGEAALLTDAPRNATVRALEPCKLLALHRADLLTALAADTRLAVRAVEMLHMRSRPRRVENIEAHPRTLADGTKVVILKDADRGAYYRLSPEGWFLWERLDGRRTLRDLTLDFLDHFKTFSPQSIVAVLGGLGAAGFLQNPELRPDVMQTALSTSPGLRALLLARRLLDWKWTLPAADARLTRLYRSGVRFVFTRPVQIVLAIVTLAGIAAFAAEAGDARRTLQSDMGPGLLWFLVPVTIFSVLLHEAGHAFTVKAFGREVHKVGVGWYWFGPIAFVDTSDMWLAGRWPRIAVTLAGPYANLILAGLASMLSLTTASPWMAAALWQFALSSYMLVLANANPLLEYDGYYVLMDALDRPNLRAKTLGWLSQEFPRALRTRGGLRGHGFEVCYAVASLVYIAVTGITTASLFRLMAQSRLTQYVSPTVASAVGILLAGLIVLLSLLGVIGDLRAVRSPNKPLLPAK
ncbi:MAG: cyclic nucleotide-binding domain-containing protein [Armatimonadota bacterium]